MIELLVSRNGAQVIPEIIKKLRADTNPADLLSQLPGSQELDGHDLLEFLGHLGD